MKTKWGWIGTAIVVIGGLAAFTTDVSDFTKTVKELWTTLTAMHEATVSEPLDEITIVLTNIEDDPGGVTTSIKRVIGDAGWDYRRLRKNVTVNNELERSRTAAERRQRIHDLRETQQGDIIIWGEMDGISQEAVVHIASRGRKASTIVISKGRENWRNELTRLIEEHGLDAAIRGWPKRPEDGEKVLAQSMGKLEYVLRASKNRTVQRSATIALWSVKLASARLSSKTRYAEEVRVEINDQLRTTPNDSQQNRRENLRLLGEAEMLKGMIDGNSALINAGLTLALEAGAPKGARTPEPWWQDGKRNSVLLTRVANLVLACQDKELIYRTLHMYLEIPGCTDSMGGQGCPFETVRAVWALRDMRHVWSEYGAVQALNLTLNEARLPYWYPRDHWGDPFTHAGRLVADEVARRERLDGAYVERASTRCPALAKYGTEYGWVPTPDQLTAYDGDGAINTWESWREKLVTGGDNETTITKSTDAVQRKLNH